MTLLVRDSAFDGTLITASGYAINASYANYDFDAFTNASEAFPIGRIEKCSGWQDSTGKVVGLATIICPATAR